MHARVPIRLILAILAWMPMLAPPLARAVDVTVSILPLEGLVEQVGGDRVAVEVLVRPGRSPATYEPSARQMAELSRADALFRVGVPFEQALMGRIAEIMPELRIIDLREGIELRVLEEDHHHHDHEGDHAACATEPGGMDPHIWLDPANMKVMARTVAEALTELDPEGAEAFAANLKQYEAELDTLDESLRDALAPLRGKTMLVFHPAWGYFARTYGLTQQAVEIEGKEPSARQLARLIEQARAEGVGVIFVQPQFSRASAEAVAKAIDAAVVPIDPLAPDYVENMRSVAKALREALAPTGEAP